MNQKTYQSMLIVLAFLTIVGIATLPVVTNPWVRHDKDGQVVEYKLLTVTGFKNYPIPPSIEPPFNRLPVR